MQNKPSQSNFQIEFDDGGVLARRNTALLPDGTYLFEDELEVGGTLKATVITSAAWLLELYQLRVGQLFFVSGKVHIRPHTKRFGVLYPPFSVTQPCFQNVQCRLIGIAGTDILPAEFTAGPTLFASTFSRSPSGVKEVVEILNAGTRRQSIAMNPHASLLSLKAKRLIDETYLAYPSIARIAQRLGVTHEHLSRQFKHDLGMSPSSYFRQLRVADAPLRLARGEEIINIAQDVGYNDLSRFYKQFRQTTNTSPGACKAILRPPRRRRSA